MARPLGKARAPFALDARGEPDAGRESVDATCARDREVEIRSWRHRSGGGARGGRGAQHGAALPGPGVGGGAGVAVASGDD